MWGGNKSGTNLWGIGQMLKKVINVWLLWWLCLLSITAHAAVDIVVNVVDDPDPIPTGGTLTYTVNVANNGPDDATGVVLTSVLPAGVIFQSVTTGQGTCTGTSTITCNLGAIANNASTNVIIKVTVPTTAGVITNNFSSTRNEPDNNASNNGGPVTTTVVQSADLQMTKTHTSATGAATGTAVQGANYSYYLTVKNNGPQAHPNTSYVTVTDNIPDGMQLTALPTGTNWNCSTPLGTGTPQNGPLTVTCTRPTQADNALNSGSSYPTITVPVRALTYGTLTNEATVTTSTMPDKNTTNNTALATTSISKSFDVGLVNATGATTGGKIISTAQGGNNRGAALNAGTTYWYRLNPALAIGSDTTGTTLTVSDPLPNGISVTSNPTVSNAMGSWNCNYSPAQTLPFTVSASNPVTLNCTSSTAYANSSTATLTLANIDFSFKPTGDTSSVANTATITACLTANMATCGNAAGERTSGNPTVIPNTSPTRTNTVNAGADLSIVKTISAGGDTRQKDTSATYTLTWRNNGPANILAGETSTITDNLPAGMSVTAISASGWTCPAASIASPIVGPTTITCTRTMAVNSGSSGSITLTATFTSTGVKTNTATIGSTINDPDPSDDQSSYTVTVVDGNGGGGTGGQWHDLMIAKEDTGAGGSFGPDPVTMTQNVKYRLRVINLGPTAVPNTGRPVTVTDTIPANSTFVSATGTGWTCSFVSPVITCIRTGSVSVGGNAPDITVELKADSGTSMTDNAAVSIVVSGTNYDPVSGNNTDSETTTIIPYADLKITKTASASSVYLGDNVTYTFLVENLSGNPAPAGSIQLTDNMGTNPGATYVSNTGSANGWTCNNNISLSCTYNNVLAVGASSTFSVTVKTATPGTARNNTASVAFVSGTATDLVSGNNSSSVAIEVIPNADVRVTKTPSLTTVPAGQNLTYIITALNSGPSAADNATVIDTLPANVTVMSITPAGGGTCLQNTPTTGKIQCKWASIGSGSSQTVSIVVRATQAAEGTTITNNVAISSDYVDLTPGNNTASASTTVTPAVIDLIVQKKDAVDPIAKTTTEVYTITVENSGPSVATNVVLTENLPHTYFDFIDATPSQGSCGAPNVNHIMLCNLGNIEAGSVNRVSITVRMKAILEGVDTNSVSVTATENDSTPANNSVSETTTVQLGTDLQVTKTVEKENVFVSVPFNYNIKVYNQGPANSTSTVLTDVIPAGMEYQSATTSKGTCSYNSGTATLTCPMGTFGPATAADISVTVIPRQLGSITNTVNVTTSTPELLDDNNQSSASVNAQIMISGRVFNDNGGDVGNIAANAYNGVQDAGETGIGNSLIQLTNCSSTVFAETTTNATGDYQFIRNSNLPNPYCIVQTNTQDFSSVSGINGGLGSYTRSTDRISVTNPSPASYTTGNFGDANLNVVLTEDGQHTVIRGAATDYPHQLMSYAPVRITQMTQTLAQQPATSSGNQPWQAIVYRDTNCNGTVDTGESVFNPTVASPVLLQPANKICLVQRVLVPINADANAQQLAKLQASYQISLINPTETRTGQSNQREDTTLIGSAGLDLQKRVRIANTCPSGNPSTTGFVVTNTAESGNFLEYEITYRNNSVKNLVDVVLKDSVPTGAIFKSVGCEVTPSGNSCNASQSNGALLWQMTGNLLPNRQGTVRFCVQVP